MSDIAFGIDLGTSTSIVSYILNGHPMPISDPHTKTPIVPSVVALTRRDELVVGQPAIDNGLPNAIIREAKRMMGTDYKFSIGDQSLTPEEVGALVLRKMKEIAEQMLGTTMESAVITVPAYFDDLPRRATEQAAIIAGIKPLRLISEPVAAALAYGINRLEEEGVLLVYDFGGGTLDVTIIEMMEGVMEVKATDGDRELGGKDMDTLLMEYAVKQSGFAMPRKGTKAWEGLKGQVEAAKKTLSTLFRTDIIVPAFAIENGEAKGMEVEITRTKFEELIADLIARSLKKIEDCLAKAKVKRENIEKLLMVGGTCYIPSVREAVESYLNLQAEKGVDPDLAVSQGAAISAGLKTGAIDARTSIVLQDAATFRMGISALEQVGNQYKDVFSELMPANSLIPFVHTKQYHLLRWDQDEINIEVLQDKTTTSNAFFAEDATPTGARGSFKDILPSLTGEPRSVDIELRYDESQIIRVTAKIVGLDKELTIQLFCEQGKQAPLSLLNTPSVVDILWAKSPLASRNAPLIKRAEKILEDSPANSEYIEAALNELKVAIADNSPEKAQEARERLTDFLVDAQ